MNEHVIESLREIVFAHHGYPSGYLGPHARRLRDAFAILETCDVEIAVYKRGRADNEHGSHLLEFHMRQPGERHTYYFDVEERALAAFDAIVPASETEMLRLREYPVRKPIPDEDLEAFIL